MIKSQLSKSYMCSACPVPLYGLAILRLHLHDIDIDKVDKLHSLTNRSLALASAVKSLALTIKSLITTQIILRSEKQRLLFSCITSENQSILARDAFIRTNCRASLLLLFIIIICTKSTTANKIANNVQRINKLLSRGFMNRWCSNLYLKLRNITYIIWLTNLHAKLNFITISL